MDRHIVHDSAHNEYTQGRPEAFTVEHGDFSGDVSIELMMPRVSAVPDDRTIWDYPVVEVSIPFEVIKQIAAEYVRRERIGRITGASDDDVLTGGAP